MTTYPSVRGNVNSIHAELIYSDGRNYHVVWDASFRNQPTPPDFGTIIWIASKQSDACTLLHFRGEIPQIWRNIVRDQLFRFLTKHTSVVPECSDDAEDLLIYALNHVAAHPQLITGYNFVMALMGFICDKYQLRMFDIRGIHYDVDTTTLKVFITNSADVPDYVTFGGGIGISPVDTRGDMLSANKKTTS